MDDQSVLDEREYIRNMPLMRVLWSRRVEQGRVVRGETRGRAEW